MRFGNGNPPSGIVSLLYEGSYMISPGSFSKKLPSASTPFYIAVSLVFFAVLIVNGYGAIRQIVTYCSMAHAEAADADEEFVGPFSSWTNVKTTYGAIGDGV